MMERVIQVTVKDIGTDDPKHDGGLIVTASKSWSIMTNVPRPKIKGDALAKATIDAWQAHSMGNNQQQLTAAYYLFREYFGTHKQHDIIADDELRRAFEKVMRFCYEKSEEQ